MMTYRANVLDDPKWYSAWQQFLNKQWMFERAKRLDEVLDKWHAVDVPGTDFISFRSEYDAMIFLITWSS